MAPRRDEWVRRTKDDLRYCVTCERYLSPIAWAEHEHNPDVRAPGADLIGLLDHLTSDIVYLGGTKVTDCASVLVIQGVEVFRLRDRDRDNRIRVDLDVRGAGNERIATIENGRPLTVAPGYRFEDVGSACAVTREEDGMAVVAVESLSSKALQIHGAFWVGDYRVEMTEHGLHLGGESLPPTQVKGSGTAIVLRKKRAEVGFAKR